MRFNLENLIATAASLAVTYNHWLPRRSPSSSLADHLCFLDPTSSREHRSQNSIKHVALHTQRCTLHLHAHIRRYRAGTCWKVCIGQSHLLLHQAICYICKMDPHYGCHSSRLMAMRGDFYPHKLQTLLHPKSSFTLTLTRLIILVVIRKLAPCCYSSASTFCAV